MGRSDCNRVYTGDEERRGHAQRLGVVDGMLPLQRCDEERDMEPYPCRAGGSVAVKQRNRAGPFFSAMIFYTTSLDLELVTPAEHGRRISILRGAFESCQEGQPRFEEPNHVSFISLSELAACIHRAYIGGRRGNRFLRLKGIAAFSNYDGQGFGVDFRYGRTWFDCSRDIPKPDEDPRQATIRVCVVALMSEHSM